MAHTPPPPPPPSHLPPMPTFFSPTMPPSLDAQSLHGYLLSCTSDDIPRACHSIESMLLHQPPETALGFFRLCFSVLLQRVFGFQESPSSSSAAGAAAADASPSAALGWLAHASSTGDEASARALLSLLSPTGPLFSSLLAIDREHALHFLFPIEHLPPRIRRLLFVDQGALLLAQASELFKNCIRVDGVGAAQVQLDLFGYYMFWFAYYAVCKENGNGMALANKRSKSGLRSKQMRSLGSWVSSLHHPFDEDVSTCQNRLYLQLLHLYVLHFAEVSELSGGNLYLVRASGRAYMSKGEFLLHSLVEFWLLKDDPWPLPASLHQPLGLSQLGLIGAGFIPPGPELSSALRLIINHVNGLAMMSLEAQASCYKLDSCVTSKSIQPIFGTPVHCSPQKTGASTDFSCGLQLLQRPLYRFIGRAFLFWPVGSPVKRACFLIDAWMDYVQPWHVRKPWLFHEAKHLECVESTSGYSARWQSYVTANYPFYTSLVVHFLEFALKFVRSDLEAVLDMTAKVFGVLIESNQLLELLKKIESTYHDPALGRFDHWDVLSSETDPVTKEKVVSRFFGRGETVACQAFQMLILQAEAEIQFAAMEAPKSVPKALEFIRDAGRRVFDSHGVCEPVLMSTEVDEAIPRENTQCPRSLGRHTCFDVKYRGDWMRRPIESTEVAWLARFLVNASDAINRKLKLGFVECQGFRECEDRQEVVVCNTQVSELDLAELLKKASIPFDFLTQSLAQCCTSLCTALRRRGWRVNLRFMAQKPAVLFTLLLFFWMLKKIL